MALYNLLLPKMGESVAEATIITWSKNVGDRIEMDDTVMEIATDKVDSEVPSPVTGTLVKQLYNVNDVVQIGSVIAVIETAEAADSTPKTVLEQVVEDEPHTLIAETVQSQNITPPFVDQLQKPVSAAALPASGARFYSPLVKNIALQEKVTPQELDTIPGSGADGRLTKDDLLAYIKQRANSIASAPPQAPAPVAATIQQSVKPQPVQPRPTPVPQLQTVPRPQPVQQAAGVPVQQTPVQQAPATKPAVPQPKPAILNPGDEIIEMDRMRRLIADHMVMSVHTSPHVTSFIEADVTSMVLWREKVKNSFEQREGTKITFTPLFIECIARAIKDLPMINVSVNGTQIIKRRDINVGMATALPTGNLIVPVIRRADQLNIVGLTKTVNDLSARARNNKLIPDEVKDGTFTVTNIGSFGNLMGTPIINQPQVAILALGAIKKKPAVISTPDGDTIGIRHMMFLSLSYDHRVVDGSLGGSFIKKVADYMESWDENRVV